MSRKEKGYIGMSFGFALEAVTLRRFGPFRTIIYRDFDDECRKMHFTWERWMRR